MRAGGSVVGLLVALGIGGSAHAEESVRSPRILWPAYPVPAEPSNAAAHDALIGLRTSYRDCLDTAGTVRQAGACTEREYAYQVARLDRIHQKWLLLLRQEERAGFQRETRYWIAYRNSACENASTQGIQEDCRVRTTADRATELEERLKRR